MARWTVGALGVIAVLLSLPASASAVVGCVFTPATGIVHVEAGLGSTAVGIQRNGAEIEVYDGFPGTGTEVSCSIGGPPDVNTTSAIELVDDGKAQDTTFAFDFTDGPLAPGIGGPPEGGGAAEIEVSIDGNDGSEDQLSLLDAAGDQNWRLGEVAGGDQGVNLNAPEAGGADGDDVSTSGVEVMLAAPDGFNPSIGDDDRIDGRGGPGFTGPAVFTDTAQVVGSGGDDVLFASTSSAGSHWALTGAAGEDRIVGGPLDDLLDLGDGVGVGPDRVNGRGGDDACSFLNSGVPITVDLRITKPQTTGEGKDRLRNCESVVGGNVSDTLTGTQGANALFGGQLTNDAGADVLRGLGGPDTLTGAPGDDILLGMGGADVMTGMEGSDTASYAQGSSGGVSVDLQITGAQDTGGAGTDTFADTLLDPDSTHEIENVTGTRFKDVLTGSAEANELRGRGGGDRLHGLDGPDVLLGQAGLDKLFALDGEADTALSCGPGANADEDAEVDPVDPPAMSC